MALDRILHGNQKPRSVAEVMAERKSALEHAVTAWDRKQSARKGYNHYALGIYLRRVDEVMEDVEAGMPMEQALRRGFNDRLLDHLLKALS